MEIVAEARRLGVFAMEAMWTRFQPAVVRRASCVAQGAIGEVVAVHADLGIAREFDPADRLFAPELGGGALLDLGVYPVSFAQMVPRHAAAVHVVGALEPTGVEGARRCCSAATTGARDGDDLAAQPDARARRDPRDARAGSSCRRASTTRPRSCCTATAPSPSDGVAPAGRRGYAEELVEVTECLLAGRDRERRSMPLDDTLAVMSVLEQAGRQLGVEQAEDASVEA